MVGDIILIAPARPACYVVLCDAVERWITALIGSPDASPVQPPQGRLLGGCASGVYRNVNVPWHHSITDVSKDTARHMSMMVHYRVSLSPSSVTTGEGRLLDLSSEGCRIETAEELPVNTYLSLRLIISPNELPILVDLAAVRWVRGTNSGVHFLAIQPLQAQRLRTFLASARSLPDQSPPEGNN